MATQINRIFSSQWCVGIEFGLAGPAEQDQTANCTRENPRAEEMEEINGLSETINKSTAWKISSASLSAFEIGGGSSFLSHE